MSTEEDPVVFGGGRLREAGTRCSKQRSRSF